MARCLMAPELLVELLRGDSPQDEKQLAGRGSTRKGNAVVMYHERTVARLEEGGEGR